MSNSRRKSALMSTILGMEDSEVFKDDATPVALDELDEQIPEELSADDLSFLDEVPGEEEAGENDPELNIEDIVGCTDENGKVKLSSIKALAECVVPDDKGEDDVLGCRNASIEQPGIEDTIGDQANGGDPSLSVVVPGDDEDKIDKKEQEQAIKEITARIDRLADYCERSGHKRLAFKLDVISDKLETL